MIRLLWLYGFLLLVFTNTYERKTNSYIFQMNYFCLYIIRLWMPYCFIFVYIHAGSKTQFKDLKMFHYVSTIFTKFTKSFFLKNQICRPTSTKGRTYFSVILIRAGQHVVDIKIQTDRTLNNPPASSRPYIYTLKVNIHTLSRSFGKSKHQR